MCFYRRTDKHERKTRKMSTKKVFLVLGVLVLALVLSACQAGEAGPAGDAGPAGPAGAAGAAGAYADASSVGCTDCHDAGTELSGKAQSWSTSGHGSGTSFSYAGGRSGCTGCHSGGSFVTMAEAGLTPEDVEVGDANPTKQDCRTCHQVHTSYTSADWALTTTDAVALIALEDTTFDGGKGNLCVNCHQPRRAMEAGVDGMFEITSSHWGPHHGPQSTMLLGLVGAGVEGTASGHSSMVADTCVTCHVGEGANHGFAASEAACVACHGEDFDFEAVQDEIMALADELGALLEAAGPLHDGHPVEGTYPEAVAQAAWNWIYIVLEDKSSGVHNPSYAEAMLEAGLVTLEGYVVTVADACAADAESTDCAIHTAFVCLADAEGDDCADLTALYVVEEEESTDH